MIIPEVVQMINGLNLILINIERILGMGGSESLPPEQQSRSRIHERTISLRFLGIIWRVLRDLRILYGFLKQREGGMVFYPVFLLSPL
jgi:hypothetical protein